MGAGKYLPALARGTRVQFVGQNQHPKNGRSCIIIGGLPNPSQLPQHQWYDVQFEDGVFGRFLECYLVKTDTGGKQNEA